MRSRVAGALAVVAALTFYAGACGAASADAPPRRLVYAFTFGTQTDLEIHSSGIDPNGAASNGSGTSDFTGGVGDQGTITVELGAVQPDHGLILKVSEQAQKTRSSPVATCVVYPTTGVICDPNVSVNPEEMSLIRLLAPGFVDPDKLDAAKHWRLEQKSAQYSLTSDFTIASNANGIMTVNEARLLRQLQPSVATTDTNAKIVYDFNRNIPTSVSEFSIERSEAGMSQHNTVKTQTVLALQSDSGATH